MNEPKVPQDALLEHAAWIRRLASSLVRDPAVADDIVQDTWVAAIERPPSAERPLTPWLRRVVQNFARQRARGEGRRQARESVAARPDHVPSAEELLERGERQRELIEAVLGLDEPGRSTVLLRYYEGLEPAQIAALQGLPSATVRSRLKRALATLRDRLDAQHGGRREEWMSAFVPLVGPLVGPWVPTPLEPASAREPGAPTPGAQAMGATTTSGVTEMFTGTKLALAATGLLAAGAGWQALEILRSAPNAEPVQTLGLASASLAQPAGAEPQAPLAALGDLDDDSRRKAVPAGTALRGSLATPAGAPLADYQLVFEDEAGKRVTLTTDAEGRFADPSVLAEGALRVQLVDHPSTGDALPPLDPAPARSLDLDPEGEALDLSATAGPSLRFAIRGEDEDGPVDLEGATVVLWQRGEDGFGDEVAWTVLRGGDEPWARFSPAAQALFDAEHPPTVEVRDASGLLAGLVRAVPDGLTPIDLQRRALLQGRLLDDSGAALAGRDVRVHLAGGWRREYAEIFRISFDWSTTTDAQGRFRFGWLPHGLYRAAASLNGAEDFGHLLPIEPGTHERDLVIEALAERQALRGTVASRTGTYQGDLTVSLVRVLEREEEVELKREAEAREAAETARPLVPVLEQDARVRWATEALPEGAPEGAVARQVGSFAFGTLPPGEYVLSVKPSDFFSVSTSQTHFTVAEEDLAVELVVGDDLTTRDLQARAVDATSGAPVKKFQLLFLFDPEGEPIERHEGSQEGRVQLSDVPTRIEFDWRIQAQGYQPIWGDEADFLASDELVVRLSPGWGTLLTVRDEAKELLPGVEVWLDGELAGVTDARGHARIAVASKPEKIALAWNGGTVDLTGHIELRDWAPYLEAHLSTSEEEHQRELERERREAHEHEAWERRERERGHEHDREKAKDEEH